MTEQRRKRSPRKGRVDQRLVTVYCLWCGESVSGRSTRRYCDGLCRWHAWAARHKAKTDTSPRPA